MLEVVVDERCRDSRGRHRRELQRGPPQVGTGGAGDGGARSASSHGTAGGPPGSTSRSWMRTRVRTCSSIQPSGSTGASRPAPAGGSSARRATRSRSRSGRWRAPPERAARTPSARPAPAAPARPDARSAPCSRPCSGPGRSRRSTTVVVPAGVARATRSTYDEMPPVNVRVELTCAPGPTARSTHRQARASGAGRSPVSHQTEASSGSVTHALEAAADGLLDLALGRCARRWCRACPTPSCPCRRRSRPWPARRGSTATAARP